MKGETGMNICVYGAAGSKIDKKFIDAVEELGKEIGRRGHTLVFGAGGSGLMGAAARGCKAGGGKIIGVSPRFFKDESIEVLYDQCDELIFTETMHERKHKMEELADAFIVVPGGIGTMEEFFETLTLKQLGRHKKPIALYNIDDFFAIVEMFMYRATSKKFVKANCGLLYLSFADIDEMFDYVEHHEGSFGLDVYDFKDGGFLRR